MTTIAGILLDKDGTLFDFRSQWLRAYRAAALELAQAAGGDEALARRLLAHVGYDVGRDAFADRSPLLWATNERLAEAWAQAPELRALPDARSRILAHLEDALRYPPRPVTDLRALFERLRARGMKLGVATMDSGAAVRASLAKFALLDLVDFVAGCDDGFGLKPDPGMVLAFAAAVGLPPARIAVVGDSDADLLMARAAGCGMAVAVLTGATPRPVLDELADHVLDSIAELERLV